MGLLDQFSNLNPEQTQGLLAAAAQILQQSGNNRQQFGLGAAVGSGLEAYQGSMEQQRRRKLQEAEAAQAAQMRAQQLQMGNMEMDRHRRAQWQEEALQGAYRGAGSDMNKLVEMVSAVDPMKGMQLRQQLAKQATKFDTKPQVGVGADGKPFTYILGEDGTQKRLDGTLPRDKMETVNLGGKDMAYNPFDLKPGQTFQRTMTPGESGSLGMQRERLNFEKSQVGRPQFNADMGGFITPPSSANPGGSLRPLAGAPARGPKMTEDQGKATGWLVQAENAFGNMKKAMTSTPSAAQPGVNDAIASIPLVGEPLANSFRGADRQKFLQGASSLSEALLRAATGAGVNRDEAMQKVREITPVFGEDPATTEQKMAAIPLYIESLKVRAGPGAGLADSVLKSAPAASGGWSIKKVN